MKKSFIIFFASLAILFLFFGQALALCTDSAATGIVPCGVDLDANGMPTCPCEIGHFFVMFDNIYGFIVKYIATSLATVMIVVGAVFMLISAGNPSLATTGKKMIYTAIIGIVLIFGSYLIIDTLLKLVGYTQNWQSLP